MPSPRDPRARFTTEIHLKVPTIAPGAGLVPLTAEIRSRSALGPVERFVLDCRSITDITAEQATDLVKLRAELIRADSELLLTNCSPSLCGKLADKFCVAANSGMDFGYNRHPLRAPHSRFVSLFRAGA
jgi:hypothetical protein